MTIVSEKLGSRPLENRTLQRRLTAHSELVSRHETSVQFQNTCWFTHHKLDLLLVLLDLLGIERVERLQRELKVCNQCVAA